MNKLKNEIELGFTKQNLPKSCHVCLIYENEEQRQKIVSEYLAAGLNNGELVRYFNDQTTPEILRSWLTRAGIEIKEAERTGAFAIIKAENSYCPDGHFDPPETIDRIVERYKTAKEAGYHGSRVCGEMSWVFKGFPGSDRILEYEVLLNTITYPFPHSGMCQYDARLFDGATLLRVLQIHPYIFAQGQLVQNPFYIKPEDFIKDSGKN